MIYKQNKKQKKQKSKKTKTRSTRKEIAKTQEDLVQNNVKVCAYENSDDCKDVKNKK